MGHKNGKGGYYSPTPLDFELLKRLPREGSVLGFHNLGLTVHVLREQLNKGVPAEAQLTADQISGRLRGMQKEGLTADVTVQPVSKGRGWQRTPKGEKFYRDEKGEPLPSTPPVLKVVGDTSVDDDESASKTG